MSRELLKYLEKIENDVECLSESSIAVNTYKSLRKDFDLLKKKVSGEKLVRVENDIFNLGTMLIEKSSKFKSKEVRDIAEAIGLALHEIGLKR